MTKRHISYAHPFYKFGWDGQKCYDLYLSIRLGLLKHGWKESQYSTHTVRIRFIKDRRVFYL